MATILTPAPVKEFIPKKPFIPDWSKVNRRFVDNLPQPIAIPIHGCSQDPAFYEPKVTISSSGYEIPTRSLFNDPWPFGAEAGFMTQMGAISVGDLNVHGHTYDENVGWVLRAEYPKEKDRVKDKLKDKVVSQKSMMKGKKRMH